MVENLQLSGAPLRRGIPTDKLQAWADRYESTPRTIRRWLSRGEETGEPCPIDNPAELKAWWARHMTWGVPQSILKAAAENCGEINHNVSVPAAEAIELSEYHLDEGEAVKQSRALVAVVYRQLERAYQLGNDVDALQKKHEKALESLRKAEASEREAAKQRGILIRRDIVERDAGTACQRLKTMRKNMVRRVLELLPDVGEEVRVSVATAIEKVREQEDALFRKFGNVHDLDPA